jgi:sugar phosphate isomerase/epimerase
MIMRLGLAGDRIPGDPRALTSTVARDLAALGISVLVTHFAMPPEEIARAEGKRVREKLADAGLSIVQASGYNPNMVHPDRKVRELELTRLRAAFAAAQALGAELVISGCGSHHPSAFYGPARTNHEPRTRDRLIDSLRQAALMAEEVGIPLTLECHVLTTLDTPEHIAEVVRAVESPWVQVNFDPVNLIGDLPSLFANGEAIRHMAGVLAPYYAPSAHVKDILAQADLVLHLAEAPPGAGLLDYEAFFAVCHRLGPGAALVVEHLPADKVPAALSFVRRAAAEHGIEIA